MLVIFEGHDLSGKSSLATAVAKNMRSCTLLKNYHQPFGDTERERGELKKSYEALYELYYVFNRMMPQSHMIFDRYYLSELVYSEVLRAKVKLGEEFYQALDHRMGQVDCLLVLVEADDSDIETRLSERGDDIVGLEDIIKAKVKYRQYLNFTNFRHKMILDNSNGLLDPNVENLIKLINHGRR